MANGNCKCVFEFLRSIASIILKCMRTSLNIITFLIGLRLTFGQKKGIMFATLSFLIPSSPSNLRSFQTAYFFFFLKTLCLLYVLLRSAPQHLKGQSLAQLSSFWASRFELISSEVTDQPINPLYIPGSLPSFAHLE